MTSTEKTPSGTAKDAFAVLEFRRVFVASFISNTGRWMQQVILGVFAWEMTESPEFLGQLIFAQLGPMLLLSVVGGSLADSVDRRRLLILTQAWQAIWGLLLAQQVLDGDISRTSLLAIVFVIGVGQAIYAPTFTAVLPSLVGRENLSAAISLNSAQVNGSRVVGPALGGWLVGTVGVSAVFLINALSYVVVIVALVSVAIPPVKAVGTNRLLGGFKIVARAPHVRAPLLTMATFAFFCLPFIGQLPTLAELNLNIDSESQTFGWLYATFGFGALIGAASVGTVLLRVPKERVARISLVGFAVALAFLAFARTPQIAFPIMFFVGLFYFALPTSLSTLLQEQLDDSIRGRVMALWVLSFGGVVPITNLLAGILVEATSISTVVFAGAVAAALLSIFMRLGSGEVVGEEILLD